MQRSSHKVCKPFIKADYVLHSAQPVKELLPRVVITPESHPPIISSNHHPTITNRHAQEFINSHLTEKHEKQKDNNTIQPFIPATSETAIETNS